MTTITANVSNGASSFPVDSAPPLTTRPFMAQIDSEQVLVDGASLTEWGPIHRGQNGTSPAAHTSGATISPLYSVTTQSAPSGTGGGDVTTLKTLTSATPATERLTRSELTLTPATTSNVSGSVAGVRGLVTLTTGKSLAGGYAYGTQGKFIGDGATIAVGSAHVAGLYGQLSLAGATVTSGHVAIIVASGQSLPASANVDGIYLESGGNVINSMFKAICNANYVMDLAKESGADTWLAASAGAAANKWLVIKAQGTVYKIALLANS